MSDILYSTSETPLKRCSKGADCLNPNGCWQPADTQHFHRNRTQKDGFSNQCRYCKQADSKRYRDRYPDKLKAKGRKYSAENQERIIAYREAHREKAREVSKQWYHSHKDRAREVSKQWREKNGDYHRAQERNRYWANRDAKIEYQRAYGRNNRHIVVASLHRREARKQGLPNDFTAADWKRALNYFDHCCAICGRPRGLWHAIAADHWIPLSDPRPDNPGTVPMNIVPLCHSKKDGVGGCNNSKTNNDPTEWLKRAYSRRKAAQILKRINAYFEWVKDQDGGD